MKKWPEVLSFGIGFVGIGPSSAFIVALLVTVEPAFIYALDPACSGMAELLAALRLISTEAIWSCSLALHLLISTALVLLIVHFWEGKDLRSIGIEKPSLDDFFWGVGAWLFVGCVIDAILRYHHPGIPRAAAFRGSAVFSTREGWLVIDLTANVLFEDLTTRGYVIERASQYTGSIWLASIASFLLSAAMHLPVHGLAGTLGLAPLLLTLTALYAWRRTIAACMLAHLLSDLTLEFILHVPSVAVWLFRSHHNQIILLVGSLLYWSFKRRNFSTVPD
ncbi:MAG TPA: CPBP family glutamic-type intramembrane protease [Candidatus Acidoferrales bacterium]|jgi:membrane protease YdiL (CAAX protease family)|nr:CPBP family glutamic-type intramembrane protease [Candidatus Acidoferrales bacterium]